jgi:hypothetical protein
MPLVVKDRVRETTTTTGTGTITLAGAFTGFQSFSVIGNGNTTYYTIAGQGTNEWEVGIGTYTASGTTLSRDTVLESSNSNSLVSFSAGTKDVFVTYPADRSVTSDYPNVFTANQVISGTDNSNAMLRITQLGTGNALLVEDSTNPDSTPFVIANDGAVGIGTTAPAATLNVVGSATIQVDTTNNAQLTGTTFRADATGNRVILRKSRSATINTNTIVQSDDVVGQLIFRAADGTNYIDAALITATVDGTPGTNDMPGRLIFSTTADGASTPTERMRIDSAGNVGIGATSQAGRTFTVEKAITGAIGSYAQINGGTIQSDVTTAAYYYSSFANTASSNFTINQIVHYTANGVATFPNVTAGGAVTNQYGFNVNSGLTGATNNYGFYSNIASGTGRWNFYANGTAANYFGGQVQLNQDYIEKRFTANSSTAITLDLANGTMQDITLTGSATITMPTAVAGKSFILFLRSGAGSYTVAWTTVKWPGGTAPTVTTTASRLDIYSFFSDGTNWYGITVSQNYTP